MLTAEEAREFKSRWEAVNRVTAEEVRRTPVEEKLRQLALMHEAGQALGWGDPARRDEARVRARWVRLKESAHA